MLDLQPLPIQTVRVSDAEKAAAALLGTWG